MFCGHCGYAPVDQGIFCPDCGYRLDFQKAGNSGSELPFIDAGHAGFWRRFVAHFVDVAIIWGGLEIYWMAVSSFGGYWSFEIPHGFWLLIALFFSTPFVLALLTAWRFDAYSFNPFTYIVLAGVLAYYVGSTTAWGSTPGKRLMRIRVVGGDDLQPNLLQVIVRESVGKVLSVVLWIGFLMVAFPKKRGLHAFLTGTKVVVLTAPTRTNVEKRDGGNL